MKVFLSHSLSDRDKALAARLRAMAAVSGHTLALPSRESEREVSEEDRAKIADADAVLVVVTHPDDDHDAVTREVKLALRDGKKPIVMLVEDDVKLGRQARGVKIVRFRRNEPLTARDAHVLEELPRSKKAALTAMGMVALGLMGLTATRARGA